MFVDSILGPGPGHPTAGTAYGALTTPLPSAPTYNSDSATANSQADVPAESKKNSASANSSSPRPSRQAKAKANSKIAASASVPPPPSNITIPTMPLVPSSVTEAIPVVVSSGTNLTDEDVVGVNAITVKEVKKTLTRRERNRVSAKNSRKKKKAQQAALSEQIDELKLKLQTLQDKYDTVVASEAALKEENAYLNSVLHSQSELADLLVDIKPRLMAASRKRKRDAAVLGLPEAAAPSGPPAVCLTVSTGGDVALEACHTCAAAASSDPKLAVDSQQPPTKKQCKNDKAG
ncbi:uncharacterized protein AMSG_04622 [Thecamonas trahens ATCC 50062]|uniref:BZIP domain-containing protein n=1 Tax=Thecamonas trahens ATCC 50062 TaxID=461836 RepID=A0A0L0D920_THETB|nr:hypothetical protein AMSG_04622 [Thecamonas trahens ATCC 50062]KNC48877.1 hypothetical protein AMSG_04622 [Thecamonas trahens ATCC 50062]|eukprot:XP_013758297.1 hypothetical protein AMSG_04622 [Thecamonas trahens ATCC 50062]